MFDYHFIYQRLVFPLHIRLPHSLPPYRSVSLGQCPTLNGVEWVVPFLHSSATSFLNNSAVKSTLFHVTSIYWHKA
jgi:hypothetical protein